MQGAYGSSGSECDIATCQSEIRYGSNRRHHIASLDQLVSELLELGRHVEA
jgi:hypothetical protein